jgi:hypothetical protein
MATPDRQNWTEHDLAYQAFVDAVLDPAKRPDARANDLLQPVLAKLSDADLDALATIAGKQTLTNHGPPFAAPQGGGQE